MKKRFVCIFIGLALASSVAQGQQPAARCAPRDSVALVLSGGGAHGLAHVGMLEVLDSMGVRPSLIVGTSIGAIIGAMYAGGMSGREIDSVTRQLPLEEFFRRPPALTFITSGDFRSPVVSYAPAFVVEQRGRTVRLQSSAARERQINAVLDQLLLGPNIAAAGDFSRLRVPFVAVATDIRTRSPILLDHGDLAQAVRASASIPVVFAPITRDQQTLIDGGLSSNVPVGAARARGARRVIVSDVGEPVSVADVQSTTGMLSYLLNSLFDQGGYSLTSEDIVIRPEVDAFGLLSFSRQAVGPLIAAGYAAARSALLNCQPIASPAPPASSATTDEQRIAERLARLLNEGVYESVWLNPRRTTDTTLAFSPIATVGPGRMVGVGLGYDNQDGVHAWLASANTALWDGRLSANGAISLGEWRRHLLLTLTGLRRHPLRAPNDAHAGGLSELLPDPRSDEPPWSMLTRDLLRPMLSFTASHETVRLYDDAGREIARPSTRDVVGLMGMSAVFSGGWQSMLAPVVHVWREDSIGAKGAETALGGVLRVARVFRPRSTGPDQSSVPGIWGELAWTDQYRRAVASADLMTEAAGFHMRSRSALAVGRELPLAAQVPLGGSLGFPGLMPDERRGERVGFASLALSHALLGPIYWRVEVGRGYARSNGSFVPRNPWVTGADVGLASDTPIGPLSLSYGTATVARRVFKLRIGA